MSTTGTSPVMAAPIAEPTRVGPVEEVLLLEQAGQPRDRVRAPPFGDLVLPAVRLRVPLEVPHPADRVRLDERRPVAAAPALGGTRDGVIHRQDVVAVNGLAGDAIARRAGRDRAARRPQRLGGGRGPAVALADENDGKP